VNRKGKWPAFHSASAATLLACFMLAGCGGSEGPASSSLNAPAPVSLTPQRDAAADAALVAPVNAEELRKAAERYRLTKQRSASHYDHVGADLNGDGRPEAIVLFSGQDWCVKTGCSLVIFQEGRTGYQQVSHITRVRPPILVGPDSNFGWRDLIVNTGGGAAPLRNVRLAFSGKGYPINALLQPEPLEDMVARSTQVLTESPAFTAALGQLAQSTAQ
jgi:hypothetical protein